LKKWLFSAKVKNPKTIT